MSGKKNRMHTAGRCSYVICDHSFSRNQLTLFRNYKSWLISSWQICSTLIFILINICLETVIYFDKRCMFVILTSKLFIASMIGCVNKFLTGLFTTINLYEKTNQLQYTINRRYINSNLDVSIDLKQPVDKEHLK